MLFYEDGKNDNSLQSDPYFFVPKYADTHHHDSSLFRLLWEIYAPSPTSVSFWSRAHEQVISNTSYYRNHSLNYLTLKTIIKGSL